MKTIAIMQPYFLPYITYFQLMMAVDEWVLLDNVHYQPRGFMTRNAILLNGQSHAFRLPVQKASQNQIICDLQLHEFTHFADSFLTRLYHAYHKAPQFESTYALCNTILDYRSPSLLEFLEHSYAVLFSYLDIPCPRILASDCKVDSSLKKSDRLIALCQHQSANRYINLPGGRALYDAGCFSSHGIELAFIENNPKPYQQFGDSFIPNLSIIDILMFQDRDTVRQTLTDYTISP